MNEKSVNLKLRHERSFKLCNKMILESYLWLRLEMFVSFSSSPRTELQSYVAAEVKECFILLIY
jgi:hypothetical protein